MSYKAIASMIPAMQSLAIVSENVRVVKKKKKTTKDMVELGVGNIVGTSMIKISAGLVGGL